VGWSTLSATPPGALGSPGARGQVGESREVGASRGLGAAKALGLGEAAMRIHVVQKPLGEGGASGASRLARVVEGMHPVRADAGAQRALRR
jgi:hypothetical protein